MQKGTPEQQRHAPGAQDALPDAPSGEQTAPGRGSLPRLSRRRWLRRFLLLLGPLVVAIVGGYAYFTGGRYVSTENAYVKADKVMVAAEVSGLIVDVAVRENQHVARGDVLFRIDDRPFRINLARAEAQLQSERAEIEEKKASYRQKAEERKLAYINKNYAEHEFKRQSILARKRVASEVRLDEASHNLDVARQAIRVIEQEMAQTRAWLVGDPDISVEHHPLYLKAKAARDDAILDLEHTLVRAPFAGVVSKKPEPGQYVTAGAAVMSIVADTGIWIDANYKETDLTHVRSGQPVTIHVDTYPDRQWQGTVESISQATGAEFSIIPPQNATGNWVKVVQRIPVRIAVKTKEHDPALRAGMSTSIEIDTGHRRSLPGLLRTARSWFGGASGANAVKAKERR